MCLSHFKIRFKKKIGLVSKIALRRRLLRMMKLLQITTPMYEKRFAEKKNNLQKYLHKRKQKASLEVEN